MSQILLDEMKINMRIRLAALWTVVMFCYVYGDYFALYIPNQAEKLVNGDTLLDSPIKVFAASVLMSIPPLVIFASVMARATLARLPFCPCWCSSPTNNTSKYKFNPLQAVF